MRVLVIGANGKIGRMVTEKLNQKDGFEVVGMIRDPKQKSYFEERNIETLHEDLEHTPAQLEKSFKGFDSIIFTAGSGADTAVEKTFEIDLDGAVKSMEAAKKVGAQKFFLISAAGADNREFWDKSGIKPYYIAKHYADDELQKSGLDYEIIRPVRLTDDKAKGTINESLNMDDLEESISREDVADYLVSKFVSGETNQIHQISN